MTKLLVGHPDLVRDDLLARVRPCLVDGLVATASSVPFVEIAGPASTRPTAWPACASGSASTRTEVAALGDHINDVALLRWAGRSVAMGDAHPLAREAAGEAPGSNAEDGAAAWLEALPWTGRRSRRRPQAMGAPGATSSGSSSSRTVPSGSRAPRTRNSLVNPAIRLRPRLSAPTTMPPSSSSAV